MPKLLIINVTCNQGSTGKIAEQVGLLMRKNGWDVYYAHGARRVNPSQLKTIPFSSVPSEYIHALQSRLFDADGLCSTFETKRLVRMIKEIQPDMVHIHNIHGYYLNYRLLFAYLNSTNIQVVMTLHDCWTFTGHCHFFDIVECEKWQARCDECPLIRHNLKTSLIDRSARNYALKKVLFTGNHNLHLVPVSEWLGGLLSKSFLKNEDISVIQNGVDMSVFKPYPRSRSDKFRILGVSNIWSKRKGLYDIVKLRGVLNIDDFEITLVGLSQNQIKKLPAGITGIERTDNQESLAKLYSDSDVLINPTYADTFPTVNLESLACGTPVITYRTGGSPEAIDNKTGVVVEQGDVSALANAIICMKENPLSPNDCRKRAEEHFDKDKCFGKYLSLFNELLNKGKQA